jgi:hypothetical protein
VKKLLITGILICFVLSAFPTCIAIYVAPNGYIYVAADSRRTFLLNDTPGKYESICKIHNVGKTYFAISGFDDGGLLSAAYIFCTVVNARYQYLMGQVQQYYPDKLAGFLKNGIAEISFFGFVNGQPKVEDIQFTVRLKKNKIVIDHAIQHVGYITVIGISADINDARPGELPSKQIMLQKPSVYVESLVAYEAAKQPAAVSAPIDLLELKPDGAVWIRKNDNPDAY